MDIIETIISTVWVEGLQLSHKKCLVALIRALFLTLSVNLVKLARECFPQTQAMSTVRRIERLLSLPIFPVGIIGKAIVKALPRQNRYILTMDRTTWELGKRIYNILAVGICFDGISLPIYFTTYHKRGATNWIEQMEFMEHVLDIIPPSMIECLVADREFGYTKFMNWLNLNHIPFCLRIRENTYVHDTATGSNRKIKNILTSLPSGQCLVLAHTYSLSGNMRVRIYALRRQDSDNDGLLILATPENASFTDKIYRLRWQIETAFRAMKTAGFNMEQTHLPTDGRFQNMLAIILIAYACAFIDGLIRTRIKKIPLIKRNGHKRFSIFSWGLSYVIDDILRAPLDKCSLTSPPRT